MTMTILEAKDLSYFYQDGEKRRMILQDTSVKFEKGQFYTILGESGSGKTTFLSLISALDAPTAGEILYNGEDIKNIGYDRFRRDDVSIIFQNYNLVPYLTGLENVLVAMSITDNEMPKDTTEIAYNLLDYIGINKVRRID
jgi:putative ABC transport system ATP-binding protein